MASINDALKHRQDYTTKYGTTIPYEDLRQMKRYNDQLNYYQKQLNVNLSSQRIKIGSIKGDYSTKMAKLDINLSFTKFSRSKEGGRKARAIATRIKSKYAIEFKQGPKLTDEQYQQQVKLFEQAGATFDFVKLQQLRDNFDSSLIYNFGTPTGETMEDSIILKIMGEMDKMMPYDLYRLIKDHEDMINFNYDQSVSTSWRLKSFLSDLEDTLGYSLPFTNEELDFLNDERMEV